MKIIILDGDSNVVSHELFIRIQDKIEPFRKFLKANGFELWMNNWVTAPRNEVKKTRNEL